MVKEGGRGIDGKGEEGGARGSRKQQVLLELSAIICMPGEGGGVSEKVDGGHGKNFHLMDVLYVKHELVRKDSIVGYTGGRLVVVVGGGVVCGDWWNVVNNRSRCMV